MSVIATTRDAVVTALNGANLTPKVTAVAAYESVSGLDALSKARLLAIPRGMEPELATYDGEGPENEDRRVTIDVVLQYRPKGLTNLELDPYLALAESITDTMLGYRIATNSVCVEVNWPEGTWVTQQFEKFMLFTITLSLVFQIDG